MIIRVYDDGCSKIKYLIEYYDTSSMGDTYMKL